MDFERIDFSRAGYSVIGVFIDALSWSQTLMKISSWSAARESRYVCLCNVHSVVTANTDPTYKSVVSLADLAMPDGMPVAWMLRRFGFSGQQRINGPDLMWRYCAQAEKRGEKIFFYGGSESTLVLLEKKLRATFPKLQLAGFYSPPFRDAAQAEEDEVVARINQSGAGVVFVGLGCPKQEFWMAEHRGRINAVMLGVGAAFDYHAGMIKRAPLWMQKTGLEWLHRLASEPQRLWKRYLVTNTLFILKSARQLMSGDKGLRMVKDSHVSQTQHDFIDELLRIKG